MKLDDAEVERVVRIYDGEEVARIRKVGDALSRKYKTVDALLDAAERFHQEHLHRTARAVRVTKAKAPAAKNAAARKKSGAAR